MTVYWKNGANYAQYQCKYGANTYMVKKSAHFYTQNKVNGIIWLHQELETDIYICCTGTYKLVYFWTDWLKTCPGMNASSATKNFSQAVAFYDFHLFF